MAPSGKAHKKNKAGRKASKKDASRKKKLGDLGESGMSAKQRNPKAFTFNSARKAQKQLARSADKEQKRFHTPMLDKSASDPPPYIVLVQGPPKVGKTTLIKCLIRHFTRQVVNDLKGPVTVLAGKKRRLTFVECPSDVNGMIDAAKFADLVLLCVDGSFGFEMETFEFLNLLQSHGFPKVMGVLTHLDKVKDVTKLRKTKKKLKARFWSEIHTGARLFYLNDFRNRKYMHHEVKNLARFLSVMKMRPIAWRLNHPYVVVDRFEDCSPSELVHENPKCDRSVFLYGYLRGCNLRQNARIHIAGVGDYTLEEIDGLLDPCPFPETLKKRGLNEKERVMYAPMSNLGGFVYDKDAVYIDIPDWKVQFSKEMGGEEPEEKGGEGEAMVRSLHNTQQTIDEKLNNSSFKFFENGTEISGDVAGENGAPSLYEEDEDGMDDGDEDDDDDVSEISSDDGGGDSLGKAADRASSRACEVVDDGGHVRRRVVFGDNNRVVVEPAHDMIPTDDSSSDASEDELMDGDDQGIGNSAAWKEDINARAASLHSDHTRDLHRLVYGKKSTAEADDDDSDDEGIDTSRVMPSLSVVSKWREGKAVTILKDRFVSGNWNAGKERSGSHPTGEGDGEESSDSELYGDFEDLETGEVHTSDAAVGAARKAIDDVAAEERREKKKARKALFDEEYDEGAGIAGDEENDEVDGAGDPRDQVQTYYDFIKEEMAQKLVRTREVLDGLSIQRRVSMEGYPPGSYVRMKLKGVPCEMVDCFDSSRPILLGGLGPGEDRHGCMRLRLKKHRWFPKILKTRDPVIFSIGWRRFQSLPIFAVEDHNRRIRMLKYTPEHTHCVAATWGPISPANSGFVALQDLSSNIGSWRICATGTVVEIEASFRIVKKLKLLGTPYKVQKNTAFISGMFNSQLEVSKFEGATIRSVSGIRGTIKKALRDGYLGGAPGSFRATFEDRLVKSDIVFLRSWAPVEIPKFCNMVTDMLYAHNKEKRRIQRAEKEESEEENDESEGHEFGIADDIPDFEAATAFEGSRQGCVFKIGEHGLGYYRDLLAPLPVRSRPKESKEQGWRKMRTVAELRREHGLGAPKIGNSEYRPVERSKRKWLPMQIPKSLISELPIKSKPTLKSKSKEQVKTEKSAVVREPHERKMAHLLMQLRTIRNEKIRKRKELKNKQKLKLEKKLKEEAKWREAYNKEMRAYRYKGQTVRKRKKSESFN